MKARSHPAFRTVVGQLEQVGYSCSKEICVKPISPTAHARIGLGVQLYRNGSLDVDLTVGIHFPELHTIATARNLPVAGSVAWTVSCHVSEFLPSGVWRFEAGADPAPKATQIVAELERTVLPRLKAFASYQSTINQLDRGFPCLWSQKRMVIPLAYVALGDARTACGRLREFTPPSPQGEAQAEYVRFAEHFHQHFCSGAA
jgi:hypothetical protein